MYQLPSYVDMQSGSHYLNWLLFFNLHSIFIVG